MPLPPTQPQAPTPHSLCPFMSGPVLVTSQGKQIIRLFRAGCAGPVCRLFDDETQDCRFNDINYEDLDDLGAAPGDPDPDPNPEPDPDPQGGEPA